MQINYTGHGVDVTDALKSLIEKKFERIAAHFSQPIIKAEVILSVEKLMNKAEINIHVAGKTISAHAETEDMYKSADQMIEKLEKQAIKFKQKHNNHRD